MRNRPPILKEIKIRHLCRKKDQKGLKRNVPKYKMNNSCYIRVLRSSATDKTLPERRLEARLVDAGERTSGVRRLELCRRDGDPLVARVCVHAFVEADDAAGKVAAKIWSRNKFNGQVNR